MKKKCYEDSKLKFKLRKMQNGGKKEVIYALNQNQLEFVTRVMKLPVVPYLYRIHTKQFSNIFHIKDDLLKEIHYKNKDGKWCYARPLSNKQCAVLKDFGVRYMPYKYKIKLQSENF